MDELQLFGLILLILFIGAIIVNFWQILLGIIIILIAAAITWGIIKQILKTKQQQLLEKTIETDENATNIVHFLSKCKTFKNTSRLDCFCHVNCYKQSVEASMCIIEAVYSSTSLGFYWKDEKFKNFNFVRHTNAYEVIDVIDIAKIQAEFGKDVFLRPSTDSDNIDLYISYPLPKNTDSAIYANCLKSLLKTRLTAASIDDSKASKTGFSIK